MNLDSKLNDGDLLLEGFCVRFNSPDRAGEIFEPSAFGDALREFDRYGAALCHHHRKEKPLGWVLSLEQRKEGIWMRARLDGEIRKDAELAHIYDQVKKGSLPQLSIAGVFHRNRKGDRIQRVTDLVEVSVTAAAVDPTTSYTVTDVTELRRANEALEQVERQAATLQLLQLSKDVRKLATA